MLFEYNRSKTEEVDRVVSKRYNTPTITLDFTTGKATATVPTSSATEGARAEAEALVDFDTGGSKDPSLSNEEAVREAEAILDGYDPEGLSRAGYSKLSEQYYSNSLSIFKDVRSGGKDSPLQHFFNEIVGDVFKFVQALGIDLTFQQRELLQAYKNGDEKIAVRSGQGPGKTFSSCIMWLHWLISNPYGLLVVTAPTMRQCKDVWLAQARQLIVESDPRVKRVFTFTNTGIALFGHKASDWGCYLATANKAENFQGIHRERLGIHCEEASGLDREIIETIQGTLSGKKGTTEDKAEAKKWAKKGKQLWLQIGNPNTRDCGFFDCFHRPNSDWTCLHWNGEETPNTEFFDRKRNDEIADEHGRDSDIYRVRVLGEFPSMDPTSIISLEDLMKCTKPEVLAKVVRLNTRDRNRGELRKHCGIDLARYGGDENTITFFEGGIQKKDLESYSRTDPNDAVDRALLIQDELGWTNEETLYIVDASGMGEAVVGRLGQSRRFGRQVHEFYSQNCAHDGEKYANKVTEAWMLFCKAAKRGEIYLKYDKKTFDQLSKRRYSVDKKGRLLIESKDDYKKRASKGSDTAGLGKSPDRADGLIMAYYPVAEKSERITVFEG